MSDFLNSTPTWGDLALVVAAWWIAGLVLKAIALLLDLL